MPSASGPAAAAPAPAPAPAPPARAAVAAAAPAPSGRLTFWKSLWPLAVSSSSAASRLVTGPGGLASLEWERWGRDESGGGLEKGP